MPAAAVAGFHCTVDGERSTEYGDKVGGDERRQNGDGGENSSMGLMGQACLPRQVPDIYLNKSLVETPAPPSRVS